MFLNEPVSGSFSTLNVNIRLEIFCFLVQESLPFKAAPGTYLAVHIGL